MPSATLLIDQWTAMTVQRGLHMNTTRLTFSLLITLLLATFVTAQESGDKSDPTDLIVLKHSWHRDFIGLAADSSPLQPNEDLMRQTRAE